MNKFLSAQVFFLINKSNKFCTIFLFRESKKEPFPKQHVSVQNIDYVKLHLQSIQVSCLYLYYVQH